MSKQTNADDTFAQIQATWEMNRRNGRAKAINLTTDTWRDSSGQLWQPNALLPVNVPNLQAANQRWVIGEVTYRMDASGTHADLTLMPKEAYGPEPFNLLPVNWQTLDALHPRVQGGAQKP